METETDQNPTSINIFIVLVELYFNLAIFIYGENIDVLRACYNMGKILVQ